MSDSVPTVPPSPWAAETLARGWQYHQAGKLELAEQTYCLVLRDNPAHGNALHLLGRVAFQRGDGQRAVALMRHAVGCEPDNAAFHHNLGLVHAHLGQLELARVCFEDALALRPDYPDALNNLGNILADQGDLDGAARCYRSALEMRSDFGLAADNLGGVLEAQGDLFGALACYQPVRQDPPGPRRAD